MKKNVFALCVAASLAGFAGVAAAQGAHKPVSNDEIPVPFLANTGAPNAATKFSINSGGIGQILLTPYYTVQGERNTLLDITNTDTVNGKVVKVRFRGARNSDDVFDFYVFLSPGENWRARVYPEGQQVKVDLSNSSACTLPQGSEFANAAFSTERVFEHRPGEVKEGYVEMLTAANIVPDSELFKAIKHDPITGEATCANGPIQSAMVGLTTADAAKKVGLGFPSTGLMGQWAITQVATNSTVSGNMTAVQAVTNDNKPGVGNIVVAPQNGMAAPQSWTTGATSGTSDPLFVPGGEKGDGPRPTVAQYFDFPDLSTPYLGAKNATEQANELSKDMAVGAIYNEFTTGSANFRTDWVLSMPTRRYGVAIDYAGKKLIFAQKNDFFTPANTVLVDQSGVPTAQVQLQTKFWDMNERGGEAASFSPGTVDGINGEVSVMSFNRGASSSVLGAELTAFDVIPHQNHKVITSGWGEVIAQSNAASTPNGLPIIGFAVASAGGRNLGFTWEHRYSPATTASTTVATPAAAAK